MVYTALDPIDLSSGIIKLYAIRSAGTVNLMPAPDTVGEARIHGNIVVRAQGAEGATRIE